MATAGTLRIKGAKELQQKLDALDRKISGPITRKACRAGAKVVQVEVTGRWKDKSGFSRKRIKVRAMKRKKGRVGFTVVTGEKDYVGKAFYAAMVDLGHKVGSRKKGIAKTYAQKIVAARGRASYRRRVVATAQDQRKQRVEGRQNFRDGFLAKKDAAEAAIVNGLRTGIDQAARQGK